MAAEQLLPSSVWPSKALPAPKTKDVLAQLTDFLQKLGYDKTVKTLLKESSSNGVKVDVASWPGSLTESEPAGNKLGDLYVDFLLRETSDDEDEDEGSVDSDTSTSDSASSSDSESEAEPVEKIAVSKPADLKRKRAQSETSDSDDSSSDSDSSEDAPATKKAKKEEKADSDSSESEDSSDDDSDEVEKAEEKSDSSSDSESDSDSDSNSNSSEEESQVKAKKTVQSVSSSRTPKLDVPSVSSSETIDGSPQPNAAESSMHPARQQRLGQQNTHNVSNKAAKIEQRKSNVPFSRIPKDTAVDPRFSSNAYVPYDYANRAHQDLIVTKGKGFTKEKNKKKRGSYRGGTIDTTPKGIKFDD